MEFVYKIRFFPNSGDRYSTVDFIDRINNDSEKARIRFVLGQLSDHNKMKWGQYVKIEIINGHNQITAGSHRLYCVIDGNLLVVYYICRKRGRKANRQDIDRATRNLNMYYKEET